MREFESPASGRPNAVELVPVADFPLVEPGADLAALVCRHPLAAGDVVVLAQKIVSKAEGRYVPLGTVVPSDRALEVARIVRKDRRLVELVLRECVRIVHAGPNLLIVEHRLGFITANAGIDQSNVGLPDHVLLLPEAPDRSASQLREAIARRSGCEVAVLINDSWGRPWRLGTVGVAIGAAGLPGLVDRRGEPDLFGRALQATWVALADELASAASLVMGQAAEATPVVIVRGLALGRRSGNAAELIRPAGEDVFRHSSPARPS